MCIIIFINYSKGHKIEKDVIVKEVISNKDKTIIDIKLENGKVIKAFETKDGLYTLGGNFDSETVYKLYNKLNECKQFSIDCLENCFQEHRIGKPISFSNDLEAEKYFEEGDKIEKTYTYQELDDIIKEEKEKKEENKRLQKQYG